MKIGALQTKMDALEAKLSNVDCYKIHIHIKFIILYTNKNQYFREYCLLSSLIESKS